MGILGFPALQAQRQISPRISGGSVAIHGEFPHQVQLISAGHHLCGGTILSSFLILTAAHCLVNRRSDSIRVVAGEHHRSLSDSTEQYRRIRQMILHENYSTVTYENDIAILELDAGLEFDNFTSSILIPKSRSSLNTTAETTGWGRVPELSLHLAPSLRKVIVQIHDNSFCYKKWGRQRFKSGMMCAGIGNRDTCGGDSGGPVTCNDRFHPRKKFVCGITSFGVSACGATKYPGVYTDVAYYYDWIREKTLRLKTSTPCPLKYFRCNNMDCVPSAATCDYFDDCGDGSDENSRQCSGTFAFLCPSGEEIDLKYECDGFQDCEDGFDEKFCDGVDIASNYYKRLSRLELSQFHRSRQLLGT